MVVKQGDLAPSVDEIVKDGTGAVVNLTGATVVFSMRPSRTPGTPKITNVAGSVFDAPNGKIRYQWVGTDTDTPGTYEAEFRVSPAAGNPMRVPTDGYITVVVEPKVA